MDLVDKEHCALPVALLSLRLLDSFAQVFDAGEDSRERNETQAAVLCEQACQSCFARAGCAPENQRGEAAAREQSSQDATFADEMCLADKLRQRAWPHALSQRNALGGRGTL